MAGESLKLDYMFHGVRCTEREYNYLVEAYKGISHPYSSEIEVSLAWFRNTCQNPVLTKPVEPQVASSVEATLAQRGSRYGDFTDHAELCQKLKDTMMTMSVPDNGGMLAWNKLSDVQKQALEVIADKIARILVGDPNYDDNWHDIQGYAKLVEDRLPKKESH